MLFSLWFSKRIWWIRATFRIKHQTPSLVALKEHVAVNPLVAPLCLLHYYLSVFLFTPLQRWAFLPPDYFTQSKNMNIFEKINTCPLVAQKKWKSSWIRVMIILNCSVSVALFHHIRTLSCAYFETVYAVLYFRKKLYYFQLLFLFFSLLHEPCHLCISYYYFIELLNKKIKHYLLKFLKDKSLLLWVCYSGYYPLKGSFIFYFKKFFLWKCSWHTTCYISLY